MAKDSSPVQQLPKHVQLRAHAGTPATQHVAPHVECGLMLVSLIHFENAIRVIQAPVATVPLPSDLSGFQGFTWTHALRMLPGSQPLPLKFVPSAASAAALAHCPAPARPFPQPRLRQPHWTPGLTSTRASSARPPDSRGGWSLPQTVCLRSENHAQTVPCGSWGRLAQQGPQDSPKAQPALRSGDNCLGPFALGSPLGSLFSPV